MYAGDMKDSRQKIRLTMNHVSHGYAQIPVLMDLNLEVRPGEVIVLVGPSGCGKTTILSLFIKVI